MVQIVEGLSFHMQMDALEGVMGDSTWTNGTQTNQRTSNNTSSRSSIGGNGALVQENFEFEQAFVKFKTGIGTFTAGYQYGTGFFGTTFLQQPYTRPSVTWTNSFGPATVKAAVVKVREYRNRSFYGGQSGVGQTATITGNFNTAASNGVANDSDGDLYSINGIFKFGAGEAGLEYEYWRDAFTKAIPANAPSPVGVAVAGNGTTNGYLLALNRINPYAKLKFGPVYIEAEGYYSFGNFKKYESMNANQAAVPDVTLNAFGAYVMAQVDFKPFFAGAKFIYKSGNDFNSADKMTGSIAALYADDYGSPAAGTLLLYNSDFYDVMGAIQGNAVSAPVTRYIDNVWFYQAFAGINPTAKLNVTAKVSYATADKKPRSAYGGVGSNVDVWGNAVAGVGIKEYVSDKYGTEVDLIATYKIYDNLSYTVGAGYLFVGDYFKGFDSDAKIKDNYLLMHKLTLMF